MYHLTTMLRQACDKFGPKPFLCFLRDDRFIEVSFNQFLLEVHHVARLLAARGIGRQDRVGIITPKTPRQMHAFYACWWLGAIAVPICECLGERELEFIIRDSEPKLILVDPSVRTNVSDVCAEVPLLGLDELLDETPSGLELEIQSVDDDAVAALIYTSGSTGMPKGVMLTHRNFIVNAESALQLFHIRDDDSIVSLLPYWHSFALVVEVVIAAMAGAAVIIPRDKRDFQKNIGRYRPTIILLVPRIADALKRGIEKGLAAASPQARRLFDKAIHNASRIFTSGPRLDGGLLRMVIHHSVYNPLVFKKLRKRFGGRLRFFIGGGAPLDIEHQIFFKYLGVPIYQGYGLTEATPVISVNYPEVHRLGSSGRMLPWLLPENGGDYTFRAADGSSGKGVKGELLVKGDCVMKGYWRHADASAKTLAHGWLHTGDMGYVDADGFLFLEGRQGNMIVLVGGEKLHPEHVEDAVKSCPLVTEAVVVGEKCKNVYVCVNIDEEQAAEMSPEQQLSVVKRQIASATEHLAAYQKPKDVLILPGFGIEDETLTVTLKVRRHKVWEKYGERIREFLAACGEEIATGRGIGIASSKIMESLGK